MPRHGLLIGTLLLLTQVGMSDPPEPARKSAEGNRPTPLLTFQGRAGAIVRLKFVRDGKQLATGSFGGTACFWDVASGKAVFRHDDFAGKLFDTFSFSEEGKVAGIAYEDAAKVLDTHGTSVRLRCGKSDELYAVALSPNAAYLATAGVIHSRRPPLVGKIDLWHGSTGQRLYSLTGGEYQFVFGSAFSNDSKRLALGTMDGDVFILEIRTGQVPVRFRGPSTVVSLAFSPTGRYLVAGGQDGVIKLWNLATQREVQVFRSTRSQVKCVAFTPDEKWVASAADRLVVDLGGPFRRWMSEVKVWSCSTGEGKLILQGTKKEQAVYGLCFNPDGTLLATGHQDGTAKVWSMKQLLGRSRPR
jgi:WD40 repeat protein